MARTTRAPRLSALDWTDGALELLGAEGPEALRINRLCEHLGVTRGSFYWHFADLDGLREAATERWCDRSRQELAGLADVAHLPPRERLRAMTLRLVSDDAAAVERSLRDWARSDERVAEVIAQADLVVFGLVQGALVELGHAPEDARVVAGLLVYAGIGFAQGRHGLPRPTPHEIDRLLELVGAQPR